jgi:lysophospholipase L1-like esterase
MLTNRISGGLVQRQTNRDTSPAGPAGRVTPCAPRPAKGLPNGAHGVTRPALLRSLFVTALAVLGISALALGIGSSIAQPADLAKWEKEMSAFEASDKTHPPPHEAILFVGSSSIRLWTNLTAAFPKHKIINRGFGGSQIADSVAFAGRIILPYKPKMIVLYAGDNDIANGNSPEQVLADFKKLVSAIHGVRPGTTIAFISIKPSPSRWHLVDKQRAANQLIKALCEREKQLSYIDVFTPMLDTNGEPRAELFVEDKLHLNPKGYELWKSVIGPYLK